MTSKIFERLDEERVRLEAQRRDAQAALDAAALDLAAGKRDAQQELTAVELELAEVRKKLERNQAARREAERQDTVEARKERRQCLEKAVARANQAAAVDRVEVAKKLDKLFNEAGALLERWAQLGRAIGSDTHSVLSLVAKDQEHMLRMYESVANFARGSGDGAAGALAHALSKNRIGVAGVYMSELDGIRPVGSTPYSFEDFAEAAADRLASGLQRAIAAQASVQE